LNNVKEEGMGWLQGEPTLEDVLSDPTVHALMKRDDVDPDDFRMFLDDVRRALEGQADRQPASGSMPRSLHTWEPSPRHAPASVFRVTHGRTPEHHPRARRDMEEDTFQPSLARNDD